VQALFSFDTGQPSFDPAFTGLSRTWLDPESFIDYLPGWVQGSSAVFREVLESRKWGQRTRRMYDRRVLEPRLTAPWHLGSGAPLLPGILQQIRLALSNRYGVVFDSAGFNLYRDGRDSVAWHGDRIRKEIEEPIVALVSLGEARKFLLRPKGGGRSRAFHLGGGDLFVTGGRTQRAWEHSVPKVAQAAGPRISIAYRYGLATAKAASDEY
jgi:alkylated DNA repair dioxygenase AlkB